jgi:dihydroorotate dehydrogenase
MTDRSRVPVIVKVPPPDGDRRDAVGAMVVAAQAAGAAGITCANTVPVADPRLSTGRGGVSGGPLRERTPNHVRELRALTGGAMEVHASGGVETADHAIAGLEAGATTVQVYTGLIYRGPGIVGELTRGLAGRLRAGGLALSDLAGTERPQHAS